MTNNNQQAVQNFDVSMLTPIFAKVLRQVQNQEARAEIQSEATVRILTGISKGAVRGKLFSYAYAIAYNTMVDYLRSTSRKISTATTLVNFCDGVEEDGDSSPLDYYSAPVEDEGYAVSTLMMSVRQSYEANRDEFSPQEQVIVDYKLYKEEGLELAPAAIAIMHGIDKSRASRAMRKLRDYCQA